jgi:hypothetical protein
VSDVPSGGEAETQENSLLIVAADDADSPSAPAAVNPELPFGLLPVVSVSFLRCSFAIGFHLTLPFSSLAVRDPSTPQPNFFFHPLSALFRLLLRSRWSRSRSLVPVGHFVLLFLLA